MDTRNAAHTHMFREPYEHRPSEVPAHSRTKMGLSQILQSPSSRLGPEVSLGLECRRRDIVSVSSEAIAHVTCSTEGGLRGLRVLREVLQHDLVPFLT